MLVSDQEPFRYHQKYFVGFTFSSIDLELLREEFAEYQTRLNYPPIEPLTKYFGHPKITTPEVVIKCDNKFL